jgi:hypothetical protein
MPMVIKPSTQAKANDPEELLARMVEAMGDPVDTWDAAGAIGRLMSVFASRMNDKDFEFWIGLLRESRRRYIESHLKDQLDHE